MAIVATFAFAGNAAEALAYYHDILGGDLTIVPFSQTPASADVPAEWQNKVCWGVLVSGHGAINVMDPPPGRGGGEPGANVMLTLEVEDEIEGERVFTKLMENGDTYTPWEASFFARKFGMGEDKYGVKWVVTVPLAARTPA